VMQDKRTTYDLGGNPVEIKFYDNDGWAYTETRTYARGYQLTDFSTSEDGDVTITTAGSYTYDTNNNLTGTKKFDASRSASQLSYRAQWSFTFDRKNRLKTYENISAGDNTQGNLWYDGKGRVWQRWNDDSSSGEWEGSLKRFVYDGNTLVQEHTVDAVAPGEEWEYTYVDINRDYLRHPAGLRQREGTAASNTDYFLQTDEAALEYKIERDPTSATADRTERSASLDQIAGGSFTSDLSNLATSADYIEMYGDSTNGFDSLVQKGERVYMSGLGRFGSMRGNNPFELEGNEFPDNARKGQVFAESVSSSSDCGCEECKEMVEAQCAVPDWQSWKDICCGAYPMCTNMVYEGPCSHLSIDQCAAMVCCDAENPGCMCAALRAQISIEDAWDSCGCCETEDCCKQRNSIHPVSRRHLWTCNGEVCVGECYGTEFEYTCKETNCKDNTVTIWVFTGSCESESNPRCNFSANNPGECGPSPEPESMLCSNYIDLNPDCTEYIPEEFLPPALST